MGAFVLSSLLQPTSKYNQVEVVCVVREKTHTNTHTDTRPSISPRERLWQTLKRYGLTKEEEEEEEESLFDNKVRVVVGDLSLPLFGLPMKRKEKEEEEEEKRRRDIESYEELIELCPTAVVHCAAQVNSLFPYSSPLLSSNVLSTQHLLQYATEVCNSLRGKDTSDTNNHQTTSSLPFLFLHISTLSCLGPFQKVSGCSLKDTSLLTQLLEESSPTTSSSSTTIPLLSHMGGYNQSKWVAEYLVHNAYEIEDIPVCVLRPGEK